MTVKWRGLYLLLTEPEGQNLLLERKTPSRCWLCDLCIIWKFVPCLFSSALSGEKLFKHTRLWAQQTVEDDKGSLCGIPSEPLVGHFKGGIFYPNLIAFYCMVYEANLGCSSNASSIDLSFYSDMTLCRVVSSSVNKLNRAWTLSPHQFRGLHFTLFNFPNFPNTKENEMNLLF